MRRVPALALSVAVAGVLISLPAAAAKRPITLDDLSRWREVMDPQRSPEGAWVAYTVRAVSPGVFIHPGATVEDMYRPERRANPDAGTVEVVGPTR